MMLFFAFSALRFGVKRGSTRTAIRWESDPREPARPIAKKGKESNA